MFKLVTPGEIIPTDSQFAPGAWPLMGHLQYSMSSPLRPKVIDRSTARNSGKPFSLFPTINNGSNRLCQIKGIYSQ